MKSLAYSLAAMLLSLVMMLCGGIIIGLVLRVWL